MENKPRRIAQLAAEIRLGFSIDCGRRFSTRADGRRVDRPAAYPQVAAAAMGTYGR